MVAIIKERGMEDTITFKPIFWRLVLWRFFPFYLGWATINVIYIAKNRLSYSLLLVATVAIFLLSIVISLTQRKLFSIVISKNTLNGPGGGKIWLYRETFSVADLYMPTLYKKQTLYEKISGFHTMSSRNGAQIMVIDFIYGKHAIKELYETLEHFHRQTITQ
jgi:hypothetical protein